MSPAVAPSSARRIADRGIASIQPKLLKTSAFGKERRTLAEALLREPAAREMDPDHRKNAVGEVLLEQGHVGGDEAHHRAAGRSSAAPSVGRARETRRSASKSRVRVRAQSHWFTNA